MSRKINMLITGDIFCNDLVSSKECTQKILDWCRQNNCNDPIFINIPDDVTSYLSDLHKSIRQNIKDVDFVVLFGKQRYCGNLDLVSRLIVSNVIDESKDKVPNFVPIIQIYSKQTTNISFLSDYKTNVLSEVVYVGEDDPVNLFKIAMSSVNISMSFIPRK